MNKILILNAILYSVEKSASFKKAKSIKDCMIYNFALGFVNAGYEVTLVASEDYQPTETETYDFEVIFFKSVLKPVFQVNLLPLNSGLWTFLRKRKDEYDVVLSSESFAFPTLFASFILPSKLVIRQELFLHNRKFFKIPSLFWYNVVVRLCYRRAFVIPCSEKAYLFIRKYAGNVSPEPIEHGIKENNCVSEKKEDQFVIVSRFIQTKRIDRMIHHFVRFIRKYPSCAHYKLMIVGDGELAAMLKSLVTELKANESIVFCGWLAHERLFPLTAQSKALLIDTELDLNTVSIPEAVTNGTAILTNSLPGNVWYIQKNILGIVKDHWNEDDLLDMVENNALYSRNCRNYGGKLSNTYLAKRLLTLFRAQKHECINKYETR
ncbi:MAG: glycosyltransferase [Tannerella sp.]|jgi:1,2-diacylglycerol 3-alpha-glucosyltransferase|nr:glycosyltransferase [Tannerella sp.]